MLIEHLPSESALHRELAGEDAQWTLENHLRAAMVDALQTGNWQRSGNDKIPRPKRIPRPGVKDDTDNTERRFGSGARPLNEIDAVLASFREEV